jgi:hypothetical protein
LAHAAGELVRVRPGGAPRVGDADPGQQVEHPLAGLGLGHVVRGHRLHDLLADAHQRVQRGHRILIDHRDLVAADLAQLPFVQPGQLPAGEPDVPAGDPQRRAEQAHDRQHGQ